MHATRATGTLLVRTVAAAVLVACGGPNEGITAKYNARLDEAKTRVLREVVAPHCEGLKSGAPDTPTHCGLITPYFWKDSAIAELVRERCHEEPEATPSEACRAWIYNEFARRLATRYPLADFQGAVARCRARNVDGACSDFELLEIDLLRTHNDQVFATYRETRDELQAQHDAEQQADAERRRAAARIFAAAAQGFAAGYNSGGTSAPAAVYSQSSTPSTTISSSCTSDYQCGVGQICVKPQYSTTGTCAQSVNEFGVPSYAPPRPSSVGIGHGNCSFDTDCPVTFRCEKAAGAVRGNCMK
jgi:hypothetical protein